jgi:hypothetical protein
LSEPTTTPERKPRAPMSKARGYFFTWLLAWFATLVLLLGDFANKALAGESHAKDLAPVFLIGAVVAVLSLPTLFLLRVLPETSSSSAVRLVRRALFGIVCGLLLALLLGACIAAFGKPDHGLQQLLWLLGALFGLIAGLIDSIALDAEANGPAG